MRCRVTIWVLGIILRCIIIVLSPFSSQKINKKKKVGNTRCPTAINLQLSELNGAKLISRWQDKRK